MKLLFKPICYCVNHDTHKMLRVKQQHLRNTLENRLAKLQNENKLSFKNTNVWDDVEEISSILHDIHLKIDEYDNQRECWDDIECLIYDV